jgi:hypothetical protein
MDLLGSGLQQMAGYCEQWQAQSVPQKPENFLEAKVIFSLTRKTPLHGINVQAR